MVTDDARWESEKELQQLKADVRIETDRNSEPTRISDKSFHTETVKEFPALRSIVSFNKTIES